MLAICTLPQLIDRSCKKFLNWHGVAAVTLERCKLLQIYDSITPRIFCNFCSTIYIYIYIYIYICIYIYLYESNHFVSKRLPFWTFLTLLHSTHVQNSFLRVSAKKAIYLCNYFKNGYRWLLKGVGFMIFVEKGYVKLVIYVYCNIRITAFLPFWTIYK